MHERPDTSSSNQGPASAENTGHSHNPDAEQTCPQGSTNHSPSAHHIEPRNDFTPDKTLPDDKRPAGTSRKARLFATPPPGRSVSTGWLLAFACMMLAAIPLLIDLRKTDVIHSREASDIVTAIETWRHQNDFADFEWHLIRLVPIRYGLAQLTRPPGTTWLHMVALIPLDRMAANHDEFIYRTRLASVVMCILAVGGVFWAGYSLGGLTCAMFAGLIYITNPLLIIQGRTANSVAPMITWLVLATASALWAMRPLKAAPSLYRQALGWGLGGLMLGMAVLTGGPLAMPAVLLPIMAMIAVSRRRFSNLLGLLAATVIATLMLTPWIVMIQEYDPDALKKWLSLFSAGRKLTLVQWTHLVVDRLSLAGFAASPWLLWVIAALIQPFSSSSSGARQRMFIGWTWFWAAILLLITLPDEQNTWLPLAFWPATAIVIGLLFQQCAELSAEGRHTRVWRVLRWWQLACVTLLSMFILAAPLLQKIMIDRNLLNQPVLAELHWLYWSVAGLALLGIALLSFPYAIRHYPGRTLVCWSLWLVLAMTCLIVPLARGPIAQNPARYQGEILGRLVENQPVYLIRSHVSKRPDKQNGECPYTDFGPLPSLALYADITMKYVDDEQLHLAEEEPSVFFLLTEHHHPPPGRYRPVKQFDHPAYSLWRHSPLPDDNDTISPNVIQTRPDTTTPG